MSVTLPAYPLKSLRFPLPGRLVDYCDGPATYGAAEAFPRSTRWAAWVASDGVRMGQRSIVRAPADLQGSPSHVFPATRGVSIGLAFDGVGREITCLGAADGTFQIGHDAAGGLAIYGPFTGTTPKPFQTLQLERDASLGDVAVFYVKPATDPGKIFLRLQRDNYATEYTLNADTERPVERIQKVDTAEKYFLRLYGRTKTGIQVRLTSRAYDPFPMLASDPGAAIQAEATGGSYFLVVVSGGSVSDPGAAIQTLATGGAYTAVVVSGGSVSDPGASISALATGGVYFAVVVSGGSVSDTGATITALATGGAYTLTIVSTSPVSDAGATIQARATGGTYAPA